jgi:hypothetical protein
MDDFAWGPIDRERWRSVPHISGALATEADVKAGRAVFFLGNVDDVPARPGKIQLPALAMWPDSDLDDALRPVVVIQVEVGQEELAGIRFLDGGNGVCLLEELEMVGEDDPRWRDAG